MSKLNLVNYDSVFLDKSWQWLTDPEIKHLTNTSDFSREDQQNWFEKLPHLKNYKIWGVSFDTQPIGVFGIKNIKNGQGEYWGYIGEKQYWGLGLGKEIMNLIINKAISQDLNGLYLKVIPENLRAVKLYEKMGFTLDEQNAETEILLMRKKL